MNRSKILYIILAVSILALVAYQKLNPEEVNDGKLTLSKDKPLLTKELISKTNQKIAEAEIKKSERLNKIEGLKTISTASLKGLVNNNEFNATAQLEIFKGTPNRIYFELNPTQKIFTDEDIYNKKDKFVLNQVTIEQNINNPEESLSFEAPAKIFYSDNDEKKRLVSKAKVNFDPEQSTLIVIITPNNETVVETENKIIFEKVETTGAKLLFKTTFKLAETKSEDTSNK